MNKKIILTTFCLSASLISGLFLTTTNSVFATTSAQVKTTQTQSVALNTSSLNIVNNPNKFLNKTVKFQATFDKFSTLGLDYKKAMRSSEKYIGFLIQRDDVLDHNIPLSEMKIFLTKTQAEKYIDLDTGDKIQITAKVFSNALGDPWLDVSNITVIKKINNENKKTEKK